MLAPDVPWTERVQVEILHREARAEVDAAAGSKPWPPIMLRGVESWLRKR